MTYTRYAAKRYVYERPILGQIEDQWWASLWPSQRVLLEAMTRKGLTARQIAWNAEHPDRQIPRVDEEG